MGFGTFALGDLAARLRLDTSDLKKGGDDVRGLGDHIKGLAVAAGLVAAGAGLVSFARKSSEALKEVAGETTQLTRLTGLSAESASRLRFAAEQTGVGTDTLGHSIVLLSKGLASGKVNLDSLGIATRDARGNLRPMDQTLGDVAEKFKTMPGGIEKNALAVKLFGRSGTELLPFLNKGRDGLAELSKQADKFGLTLTQNNLDAIRKNLIAHREFHAALEGLQVQVGVALLPVLTRFAEFITSTIVPGIVKVTQWVRDHLGPAFATAQHAVENSLLPRLKDLAAWLGDHVLPAAQNVASYFANNFAPTMGALSVGAIVGLTTQFSELAGALDAIVGVIGAISVPMVALAAVVVAAGAAFFEAYKHSESFRHSVDSAAGAVSRFAGGAIHTVIADLREFGEAFAAGWSSLGEKNGGVEGQGPGKLFVGLGRLVHIEARDISEFFRAFAVGWHGADPMRGSVITGPARPFVLLGQFVHNVARDIKEFFQAFVVGWNRGDPRRGAVVSGPAKPFADLGVLVRKVSDDIKLFFRNFIAGWRGDASKDDGKGPSHLFFQLGELLRQVIPILEQVFAVMWFKVAPAFALILAKVGAIVASDNFKIFVKVLQGLWGSFEFGIGVLATFIHITEDVIRAVSRIAEFFEAARQRIVETIGEWQHLGVDIVMGIVSGIASTGGRIAGAVTDALRSALSEGRKAIFSHSPSRLFADQLGATIPQGVALGIVENIHHIDSAMSRMNHSIAPTSVAGGGGVGGRGGNTYIANFSTVPYTPQQVAGEAMSALRKLERVS